MIKLFASLVAMVLLVSSCNADNKKPATSDVKLSSKMDSVSYILGFNWGSQLKKDSLVPNIDALTAGFIDAAADKGKMDEATRNQVIQAFVADLQAKQQKIQEAEQAKLKESGPQNLVDGQNFLAANKVKEGIRVTASGLQYKIINPGSAKKPQPTDEVTVHYKGSLINGKVFDSSYDRKQPSSFPLNGVVKGWTEGLQLIGEGGKILLYLPSELAYGDQAMGNVIPPNSVLIFEVELLKIGK